MKPHCHFYFSEQDDDKLDIRHILTSAPNDTIFYVCGPSSLLNDTLAIADKLDASLRQRINVESFQ
jgi:ferredoxin-NADP reductase